MELQPFGVGDALLSVQIAPGADLTAAPSTWAWTQIQDDVRVGSGIAIKSGRDDERSTVGPGRMSLVLDNTSGNYSMRNPVGRWYGLLARNTPIRARVWLPSSPEVTDAYGRTSASGWSTADSGQAWTSTGAGGTVSATDYSVGSGVGVHSIPAASAYRFSYLPDVSWDDVDLVVTVTLSVTAAGGAIEPAGLMARVTDVNTYYLGRLSISQTTQAVTAQISVAGGTAIATASTGITHSAGQALRVRMQVVGSEIRMRVWVASGSEPGTWTLETTDTTLTAPGGVGVRSGLGAGNSNTKPVLFSYDNFAVTRAYDLGEGYVTEWPPRWDKSGNDATVPIEAAGILRRLAQRKLAKRSPLWRTIEATGRAGGLLLGYWPLEDDEDALRGASALAGGEPIVRTAGTVVWGGVDGPTSPGLSLRYGTTRLVQLQSGGVLAASVPTTTATEWAVQLMVKFDVSLIAPDTVVARWYTPGGTYARWDLIFLGTGSLGGYQVKAYTAAGSATTILTNGFAGTYSGLTEYRVDAKKNGTSVDIRLIIAANIEDTDTLTTHTLAPVRQVVLNPDAYTQTTTDMAYGHLQVWADQAVARFAHDTVDGYGRYTSGRLGWLQEAAHDRFERCCTEDQVPVTITSTPASGYETPMGSQPDEALLPILRQCELADGGLLYESGHGLAYQPRAARYNAPVALALSTAGGEVSEPPEPTDDDQQLTNDVTVHRVGGSSARYVDENSIAANDRYDATVDLNVYPSTSYPDRDLDQRAAWLVHLGTADELRYPQLEVDFARNPNLLEDWLTAGGIGSRITLSGLPDQVPGDADLIVEGYSMHIGYAEWDVAANCSPASAWRVFELESTDGNRGRIDTGGSTLASSATSTATTLSVATASGPIWTPDPTDWPFDIDAAGERVTVTGVGQNLVTNGGFEAGTTGWTNVGGSWNTSTVRAYHGATSGLLVCDGVSSVCSIQATSGAQVAVTAGLTYLAQAWLYASQSWTSCAVAVDWYTAASAFISTSTTVAAIAATTWTLSNIPYVAPPTAAFARIRPVRCGSTPPGTLSIWADLARLVLATTATSSPQTLEVTRSVNGVVKAQASGAGVSLWRPPVIAL